MRGESETPRLNAISLVQNAKTVSHSAQWLNTVTRSEEEKSLCASDVYFTDEGSLDTSLVSSFPTFTLTLYRHNGSTCLASVDGSPVAYVQRTQAVDLIEAVNQVILGS